MEPSDRQSGRLRRIEAALQKLPRLERQIFLAARLDDMSVPEIARCTGLSERQVNRCLVRAFGFLTRELEDLS